MLSYKEKKAIDSLLKSTIEQLLHLGWSKDMVLKGFIPTPEELAIAKYDPVMEYLMERASEMVEEIYNLRMSADEINKLAAEHRIR